MSCVSETPKAEAAASVRFRLIRLLERTGHTLGLSRTMTGHLAYLIRHTREIDWEPGNRAIVYKSVTNMARDHGISERQINNRERELIDILELDLELSGNFRRYGERDADTGRIKRAFGIDLTPLKDLIPDLETALAEQEAAEERWRDRKRELSALKGRIRKLVDAAIGLGLAEVIAPLLDQRAGYQDRIRAETPIEEIERRILCARRLKDRLERAILLGKTDELPVKTSDRAEADFRHKDLPNDSLTNDKSFGRAPSVDNRPAAEPARRCPALPLPFRDSRNLPNADQPSASPWLQPGNIPLSKFTTEERNPLESGYPQSPASFIRVVVSRKMNATHAKSTLSNPGPVL